MDETGLLKELFSRVWVELSEQKLKLEDRTLAKLIPQALGTLLDLNRVLFDAAWEALAIQMKKESENEKKNSAKLVSVLLKAMIDGSSDSNIQAENKKYIKEKADELLKVISKDDLERIESLVLSSSEGRTADFDMIQEILEQFRERLFIDQVLACVCESLVLLNLCLMAILTEMGCPAFRTCLQDIFTFAKPVAFLSLISE